MALNKFSSCALIILTSIAVPMVEAEVRVDLAVNASNRSNDWQSSGPNSYMKATDGSLATQAQTRSRGRSRFPAWLEFQFGGLYEDLQFSLQEDNRNPYQVRRWKIQGWDAATSRWRNLPAAWERSNHSGLQRYPVPSNYKTSAIRVFFQAPRRQAVGLQELKVSGVAVASAPTPTPTPTSIPTPVATPTPTPGPQLGSSFTLSFRGIQPLRTASGTISYSSETNTRFVDWEGDGDQDILVAVDGKVDLVENTGTRFNPAWKAPRQVVQAARAGAAAVVYVDLTGDGKRDLVVVHSRNNIALFENRGSSSNPVFANQQDLSGVSGKLRLNENNGGRFDLADWNNDGLLDIITGGFEGTLKVYENTGSVRRPIFNNAVDLSGVRYAYNHVPRVLDINADGQQDIILGNNWAEIKILKNTGQQRAFTNNRFLETQVKISRIDGTNIDMRSTYGDNLTPDVADINGDNVVDFLTGNRRGDILIATGYGVAQLKTEVDEFLAANINDLSSALDTASQRNRFAQSLHTLRAIGINTLTEPQRLSLVDWYEELVATRYPDIFQHQALASGRQGSPGNQRHLDWLSAQLWINLIDTLGDGTLSKRQRAATIIGVSGRYRQMFIDFGILYIDNKQSTAAQLDGMFWLFNNTPKDLYHVKVITSRDYMGPNDFNVDFDGGVNIFSTGLSSLENSFPNGANQRQNSPQFMLALAHEVNHRSLDHPDKTVAARYDLLDRKYRVLARAAGPDVFYHPGTGGWDRGRTQQHFQARGYWNGNQSSWDSAWQSYFDNRGRERNFQFLRNNMRFFIEAPQEGFATLANMYYASTEKMLALSKDRWDSGYRENINQALLFIEYYSLKSNTAPAYLMTDNAQFRRFNITLGRNANGHITSLELNGRRWQFSVDQEGYVTQFFAPTNL